MASPDDGVEVASLRARVAELERELAELRAMLARERDRAATHGGAAPPPPPTADQGDAGTADGARQSPPPARQESPASSVPAATPPRVPVSHGAAVDVAARTRGDGLAAPEHRPPADAQSIEGFVGSRLVAWLGAIVLVVALGLFVHLGVTRGWFQGLGPVGRLTLGYLGALGCIVGADLLRRRLGTPASVGLGAAGVAGLYLTTSIGVHTQVISSPTLGVLVATIVAAAGLVATLRFGSLAIAVLAVVGGFLAPIFGFGFRAGATMLAVHLTVCLLVGLVPSALDHARFRPLRFVTLVLQAFFGLVWLSGSGIGVPMLALVAVVAWWLLFVAEAAFAAMRGRSPIGNVVLVLLATVIASTGVAPVLAAWIPSTSPLAFTPLMMAALAAVVSWLLPNLELPANPEPGGGYETIEEGEIAAASGRLARTLRLLAVLLLGLAPTPWLGASAIAVTWALAAVAFSEAERRGLLTCGRLAAVPTLLASGIAALVGLAMAGPVTLVPLNGFIEGLGSLRLSLEAGALLVLLASAATLAARSPDRSRFVRGAAGTIASIAWFAFAVAITSGEIRWFAVALGPLLGFVGASRVPLRAVGSLVTLATAAIWLIGITDRSDLFGAFHAEGVPLLDLIIAAELIGAGFLFAMSPRAKSPPGGASARWRDELSAEAWVTTIVAGLLPLAAAAVLGPLYARRYGVADQSHELMSVAAGAMGLASVLPTILGVRSGRWLQASVGVALTIAAAASWLVMAVGFSSLQTGAAGGLPFLNLGTLGAIGLAPACAAALWAGSRGLLPRELLVAAHVAIAAVVVAVASRELARGVALVNPDLVQPALSLAWGACGAGLILLGWRRSWPALRWTGLGALGIVAGKVLVVDLGEADTLVRVLVLVGVGVLLVVVSVLYTRRAAQRPVRPPSQGGDATP